MRRSQILVALVAVLGALGPESLRSDASAQVVATGEVTDVVVYPDRALVTRRATVTISSAKPTQVVIRPLPPGLRDDSIRATIRAGSGRILDVETSSYPVPEENDEVLRKLRAEREGLKGLQEKAHDQRKLAQFRQQYLKSVQQQYLGEQSKKNALRPHTPREYDAMLEYLSERLAQNLIELRRAEKALTELTRKARFLDRKIADRIRTHRRSGREKQAILLIEEGSGPISVDLSYVVPGASWKPGYDVRILRAESRIEFNGYGLVSQRSGEDWVAARIKLSTARPSTMQRPPEVDPLYVGASAGKRGTLPPASGPGSGADKERGGSLVFSVPKQIPIAADGRPHRTPFTRHSLPVNFEYITFPRFSDAAYLLAIGKNTMESPILTGQLHVFQGNDFVGASQSGSVLPGEAFELTLGVNENIRVSRRLEELAEEKAGLLGGTRVFRYAYMITVGNFSGKAAVLNVVDQIPVTRGVDVRVTDIVHSLAPDYTNKQGIMKWKVTLKSGESRSIRLGFSISVPEGRAPDFFRTEAQRGKALQDLENDERTKFEKNPPRPSPALRKYQY